MTREYAIGLIKEQAYVKHACMTSSDREGYPIEIHVCKKWKTKESVENGIRTMEWYGRLDENEPCTCGADQRNARVAEALKVLGIE